MKEKKKFNIIGVENANDFVGLKITEKEVELYIPRMFRAGTNEDPNVEDIVLFLKSFSIAKTLEEGDEKQGEDKGNIWPIDSYLWIIKDYLENGYYYNREKIYRNDRKGKIDWKKTLRTVPIYSNGNLIYDKLVTSSMSASNDKVAQIYRICLKHSVNKIGWLFSFNFHVDVKQYYSNAEMVHIIKKELSATFDDIKRLRFRHMLKILENIETDNALSNDYVYGIKNYYYVFEQMVDIFFQGIKGEEKKKYYPSGYWQLNNLASVEASSLRPDTIYKKDDETFIIDAKMYQYGATHDINDLPQTESMQKQITYGDYVYNVLDDKKVRNVFILPYNKKNEKFVNDPNIEKIVDENLVYIGKAFVDWRNNEARYDHDFIYTFMIDFNYLLKNYLKDNRYILAMCEYINKLI